jgi:DNA-binding CsgD family transcriptional regulator
VVRGRSEELERLTAQIDQLGHHTGCVTLIEGGPGMGKSLLLSEIAIQARQLTMMVADGAALADDALGDCGALLSALCDPRNPLLDREAIAGLDTRPEQRPWLIEDLRLLLAEMASRSAMLICLDDLHWSDPGTGIVLQALSEQLADAPISWVVAYRLGQAPAALLSTIEHLEHAGAQRIVLGALGGDAVAELTADIMHAAPDPGLLALASDVGGNPRLLTELLIGLREDGLVSVDDGQARLLRRCLPARFHETLGNQLERLSDHARQAALVAAALGTTFSFTDLGAMLQLSPAALLGPLTELIDAGLVVDAGDGLRLANAIIGDVIRGSVPASTRRALDRQAIGLLSAHGEPPAEVAVRFAASAEAGDEAAIVTLLEAGATLVGSDPATAADISERALELMGDRHELWSHAIAQRVSTLEAAGKGREARSVAEASLHEARTDEQRAEIRLSVTAMLSAAPDLRVQAGQAALRSPELPAWLAIRHRARLACNLLIAGRIDEARTEVDGIMEHGDDARDDAASVALHLARSGLAYADGRFAESLKLAEQATRISGGEDPWEPIAQGWRCQILDALDRYDESDQLAADVVGELEGRPQPCVRRLLQAWRARHLLRRGDIARAHGLLAGAEVSQAGTLLELQAHEGLDVVALAHVAIHTANGAQARRLSVLAHSMLSHSEPAGRHRAAWALALQAAADRDSALAHRYLSQLPDHKSGPTSFPVDVTDEILLARVGVDVGDERLVRHALEASGRRAELNPGVCAIAGAAAHVRGLASADAQQLQQAAHLFAATPRVLDRAAVLEDLAALCGLSDPGAETRYLDQALVLYCQVAAVGDERRVRTRLRSLGVRRRLVSIARPERGWTAMTGSEAAVAELVATGLTNRQVAQHLVVSPHTVNSHLRNVFTKLDVRSRGELALRARAHDQRT